MNHRKVEEPQSASQKNIGSKAPSEPKAGLKERLSQCTVYVLFVPSLIFDISDEKASTQSCMRLDLNPVGRDTDNGSWFMGDAQSLQISISHLPLPRRSERERENHI